MTRSSSDAPKSFQHGTPDDPAFDERIARLLHGSQDALRFVREFARLGTLHRSERLALQPQPASRACGESRWRAMDERWRRRPATGDPGQRWVWWRDPVYDRHQVFLDLIDAYRSENGLWDLFGQRRGTVTVTTFKGKHIFGSNSRSPTYTRADRTLAEGMRRTMRNGKWDPE
jgi:hypothetical protein